jgi:hypothetical protein
MVGFAVYLDGAGTAAAVLAARVEAGPCGLTPSSVVSVANPLKR